MNNYRFYTKTLIFLLGIVFLPPYLILLVNHRPFRFDIFMIVNEWLKIGISNLLLVLIIHIVLLRHKQLQTHGVHLLVESKLESFCALCYNYSGYNENVDTLNHIFNELYALLKTYNPQADYSTMKLAYKSVLEVLEQDDNKEEFIHNLKAFIDIVRRLKKGIR